MGATLGFALVAGLLSILSPCVLPLLPIVVGAATAQGRFGPLALSGGLALSFTTIGLFVATIGFGIGLDSGIFRQAAALVMAALGAVLLVPSAQARFAMAGSPVGDWAERRFGGFSTQGWIGQFGVGLLLGAVWSPCVGPTLGAASIAASQRETLSSVALTMAVFGLGAAIPLLALGFASREALSRWRDRLRVVGGPAKQAMGGILIATGILILTGADKRIETWLVDMSPDWLTALTTRF